MTATATWAATAPESGLAPLSIDRRELRDEDVAIDIAFCGVCHSDLHAARNDWKRATYPFVPALNFVTPAPTALTVPTISWPGTNGYVVRPQSLRAA